MKTPLLLLGLSVLTLISSLFVLSALDAVWLAMTGTATALAVSAAALSQRRANVSTTGVTTGLRTTGVEYDEHREVVVDLMVARPGGGQFPAHETTLVPADALHRVAPGSVVDVYYRRGDESAVVVSVVRD